MPGILTLLTDFGLADSYVGEVKGTVLRLAPGTQLVDLSHEVAPGDVEGAADLLAAAAPAFPAGTVHLAVVDPGVGSSRRLLVAHAGGHQFVAPDNGLLTPQIAGGGEAWAVTRGDVFLAGPGGRGGSATFHGRDRFAPVAAALLRGDHPNALGGPIHDAARLSLPASRRERDAEGWALHGRIACIDRFGNLVTDIPGSWLAPSEARPAATAAPLPATTRPAVAVAGAPRAARLVTHYAELAAGEPGLLIGSRGTLELSLRGESLAACWSVARGDTVTVRL